MVSHDVVETFAIADQVVLLAEGKVAASGTPAELRASSHPLVRQFIGLTPDGPVEFHYPGPSVEEDFVAEALR